MATRVAHARRARRVRGRGGTVDRDDNMPGYTNRRLLRIVGVIYGRARERAGRPRVVILTTGFRHTLRAGPNGLLDG